MFGNELAEYDPYADARRPRQPREGEAGDARLPVRHGARRHVQRGRLPRRPPARRHATPAFLKLLPVVEADAKKIGITFHVVAIGRRLPDPRDDRQEHPVRGLHRLGEGLSRRGHVPLAALRQPPDHPGRQRRHLTRRPAALAGDEARPDREHGGHPERRRRPRPLRRAGRPAAAHVLRAARQEADDGDRPVGSVPAGERRPHHRPAGSRSGSSTSSPPPRRTPTSPSPSGARTRA